MLYENKKRAIWPGCTLRALFKIQPNQLIIKQDTLNEAVRRGDKLTEINKNIAALRLVWSITSFKSFCKVNSK